MQSYQRFLILLTLPLSHALSSAGNTCGSGYTICNPSGAETTNVPKIGDSSFSQLYLDLIATNVPDGNAKRSVVPPPPPSQLSPRQSASLCCVENLSCYAMANLKIPFCYDKFTTNYFLPDASYGSLYDGAYTSSDGTAVNFLTGTYKNSSTGSSGNIYSADPSDTPNTSTLSIPSQFTGTGIGGAIPASALGGYATVVVTSTILATTIEPTTLAGSILTTTETNGGSATTRTSTLASSTVSGSTVRGDTILVTSRVVASATGSGAGSSTAVATSSSSGAARSVMPTLGKREAGLLSGFVIGAVLVF